MKKYIAILSISCILFACDNSPKKNLDEFKWLIGKWEADHDGMMIKEIWKEENNTLSGEGMVLAEADTLFHEKVNLEIRDNTVFYMATTPQNKAPVPFQLISSEKNKWKFENKEHDFPQLITYTLINSDSLVATIEGIDKGIPSKEEFYFKKAN